MFSHEQAIGRESTQLEFTNDMMLLHGRTADCSFWKENTASMPLLARVARSLFGLPLSQLIHLIVECFFSVLTRHSSRITHTTSRTVEHERKDVLMSFASASGMDLLE